MTERARRPDAAALTRFVLLVVAVWIALAFFNSSEFYRGGIASGNSMVRWADILSFQLTSSLMWAVFTPVIIFIAERLPIEKPHRLRNAALLLAIVPVLAVVRAVVGATALQLGEGDTPAVAFLLLSTRIRFHQNVFFILVLVGITNFVLVRRRARERERAAFALQTAVADAEIQRLRVTIQPRYLFSTLEEIAARVRTEPAVADRILVELSELLRDSQELARRGWVSLGEELELIDRYFDIENTRTRGRFTARILLGEDLLHARVPAMILRPLIESACVAGEAEAARTFEIRGRADASALVLEVSHDQAAGGPDAEEASYAGASVQRRIEGAMVVTEIRLPLVLPAEASAS